MYKIILSVDSRDLKYEYMTSGRLRNYYNYGIIGIGGCLHILQYIEYVPVLYILVCQSAHCPHAYSISHMFTVYNSICQSVLMLRYITV